ncbi:outer membrane protein [Mizugakiibacter sediminis]|uniref:Outer membrane protein n=1 Tax=Mizugakiibacter sediminis TaxID=1475481 RepID=A0A0K8QLF0_9GAMM|nr:efflux transporter outer membrane subunit [Mizugakiibacter sediminis]GAP65546.1 outer membrane protein [Mizugakiibacter sediminis]
MRPRTPAFTLGLILALAGCASTGGLEPSGSALDPAQLHAERSLADAPLRADGPAADWWRVLGDPQLDALIDEALAGNPGLAVADARVRLAQAAAGAADAARKPELTANAGSSGIRIPETVIEPPLGGHYSALNTLSLKFGYGFDLWGGKRAAWEAALGEARAAEVDAQAARLLLSADVTRAYLALANAYERLDLARDERTRAERTLELTRQRVQAGIDNQLQLRQAEAAVPAAEQRQAAAQQDIDTARAALAALLGRGPDRGLAIERPRPLAPAALALPSNVPADLLGRRPDVVAARWRVQAAGKRIKTAKAAFYPNLNLAAAVGFAALGTDGLLTAPSRYYQFAPALSLPLFDGGRLRANLAGADAQYDVAVAQYNQTLVNALRDVADGVAALRALDAQVDAQQRTLDSERSAFDLAMQRYRAGVGSYLEVLTVQQPLIAAEQQLAALRTARLDASVQLIEALGGGFRAGADAPPPAVAQTRAAAPTP